MCQFVCSEVTCAAQAAKAEQSTASSGMGHIGTGSGSESEAVYLNCSVNCAVSFNLFSLLLAVVANGRVLKQI
ncbi:hypothetical protein TcasGA2_TC010828 [Tribolium castaneum]|uniref:Uncharacterized protein n=1 Tax=Tribolium castaneum TaxID=7070 RepID=D6W7G5_TRICA|nr:hypothetical protein TcasGA2_TC010828 [Tribolium castaneum]